MAIPGGYILQPRCVDDSAIMHESPVVRELWFYLLRRVNHKTDGKYERGSGFFNLGEVQENLCWYIGYRKMKYSKPQLTKSLRRLRERNMIATARATHGVYITILNYDYYQTPENYKGNDEGQTKEIRRKQSGHTKNKNVKNEEEEYTPLPSKHPKTNWGDYHTRDQEIAEEKLSKKTKKKPKPYSRDFLRFWEVYPKKVAKRAAFKAWENLKPDNGLVEKILGAIETQKQSPNWKKDGGQFIPNPATWLNGERWEDEADTKGGQHGDAFDRILGKS